MQGRPGLSNGHREMWESCRVCVARIMELWCVSQETEIKWHLQPAMGTEKGACLFQGDLLLRSWCFLSQFPSAPCESKIQHMLCASCACLHTPARHFELSQSLLSTGGAELHWAGNSCFSKCIVNLVTICNSLESCFELWQWIRQGWDFRAGPGMVWKPKSSWVYKAQGWRSGWDLSLHPNTAPTPFTPAGEYCTPAQGERESKPPGVPGWSINYLHIALEKTRFSVVANYSQRHNLPGLFPLSADEMCTCTWAMYTKN